MHIVAMDAPASLIRPLSVGERIQIYRKRQGLSQDILAADVTISTRQLRRIERGEDTNPGIETLTRIAATLGISLATLLFGDIGEQIM